jgi:hypothetical protein
MLNLVICEETARLEKVNNRAGQRESNRGSVSEPQAGESPPFRCCDSILFFSMASLLLQFDLFLP